MKKNFLGISVVIILFLGIMTLFFTLYKQNYSISTDWSLTNADTGAIITASFSLNFEKDLSGNCIVSGTMTVGGDTYKVNENRCGKNTVFVGFEDDRGMNFVTARFDINAKFGGLCYDGVRYEGPAENKEQAAEIAEKLVEDNTGETVYDW